MEIRRTTTSLPYPILGYILIYEERRWELTAAGLITRKTVITDAEAYYGPAQGQLLRLAQLARPQNGVVQLAKQISSLVTLLGKVTSSHTLSDTPSIGIA